MNVQLAGRAGTPARLSSWRLAVVVFAVAVAVLLACYWQTAQSLVGVWVHDGTYQYAVLIFPLSLWVAISLRHRLRAHPPVPSAWGLVAVAILACIWYGGQVLAINLLQHFAFVTLFPALVLTCWGWRALRVLVFPLAYLVVFAVPWGDGLVGPLQNITARFAVDALQVTGTPVLLNGREIVTPSAVWMVEQACSGVKFFIACTALGSLFAYLMYTRAAKRVAFVVLAAIVPVIANVLRVYFTVLIGETFGMKYATGTDHMIFGWQFFGTVLLLLLLVGWFFRDRVVTGRHAGMHEGSPIGWRHGIWPVAVLMLVAAPVLVGMRAAAIPPQSLVLTAPVLSGWHGPHAGPDGWRPAFKGAAGEVQAAYQLSTDGATVELFHAVYTGRPRRGHSLITYGNDVYDHARARVLETATRHVGLGNGMRITARELRLAGAGGGRLVWYWYCVDRRCTVSPVWAKVLQAWHVLRGGRSQSSVWALSLPVSGSAWGRARKTLRTFARALPGTSTPVVPVNREMASGGALP